MDHIYSMLFIFIVFCFTEYDMTTQYEGPNTESNHYALMYSPIVNMTQTTCLHLEYLTSDQSNFKVKIQGKTSVDIYNKNSLGSDTDNEFYDGFLSITLPRGIYQVMLSSEISDYDHGMKSMIRAVSTEQGTCESLGKVFFLYYMSIYNKLKEK